MDLVPIPFVVCAVAYGFLSALLLARRSVSRIGRIFLAACVATTLSSAGAALGSLLPAGLPNVADSLSAALWLFFASALTARPDTASNEFLRRNGFTTAATIVGSLAIVVSLARLTDGSALLWQAEIIARLVVAVLGISLVENLFRRTTSDGRWAISPLCIGLGSVYAFELYFYSDAFLFRHVARALLATGAVISTAAVPLLAMSMARNSSWQVPIRISREAVFHGVTLVASGIFLVSAAAIGSLVRRYGGDWSLVLQVSLLFGSATVLGVVLSSVTAKSYLRNIILKNFFPYRYDYRLEWKQFTETLSSNKIAVDLSERLIRSLADIVNSPGGALFQRHGNVYLPTSRWNARLPADAREAETSPFISRFKNDASIVPLRGDHVLAPSTMPHWMADDRYWLAVPLFHKSDLIGFVALLNARSPFDLDWEVFDLLSIAACQSASYLAEHEATAALADAQMLEAYSKRFAFVVHDIKNMSNQLALIVSNAKLHGDDPEFRADLLLTIENSVGRMNKLLSQLKAHETSTARQVKQTDVGNAILGMVASHPASARLEVVRSGEKMFVGIEEETLKSALAHLVENALQASGVDEVVTIDARKINDHVVIEVLDKGSGMEMAFIRDRLFRPFSSTKPGGYGIGAFQTRDIVKSAGGTLEALSTPGVGTTMRIVLPIAMSGFPTASVA